MPSEGFFSGKLVRLAALQRGDLPLLAAQLEDPEYLGYAQGGLLYNETLEDLTQQFDQDHRIPWGGLEALQELSFGIHTLDSDLLIGKVELVRFDWRSQSAEVGIGIGNKAFWDKGYGTDAMRVLLRYTFMELGLHRVQLDVFSFNRRAARSYEKAGFSFEGARREAIYRDGVFHDDLVMSILRQEWDALPEDKR